MATKNSSLFQLFAAIPVSPERVHCEVTQVYPLRRPMLTRARRMRETLGESTPIYEVRLKEGVISEVRLMTAEDFTQDEGGSA